MFCSICNDSVMAVYFKYKSAKHYDSIRIVDPFISVGNLKLKIFESKRYGRGKDFDLLITNSQSKQDYVDETTLIPKNTSVSIRRVPGLPLLPIVIPSVNESKQEDHEAVSAKCSSLDFDCDDFGDDVYAMPKTSGNPVSIAPTSSINDEDAKVKNLILTPCQSSNGYGFGKDRMDYWKKPPSGYVCHRCNVPGHYIQHCPTNGDPYYDMKKVKPSMSMATTSSGSVGVSKAVEGFSSASSSSSTKSSFRDVPPELHCPLCKGLMKDAVIASKCCFSSFCDKCIRNHVISNSVCVCGAGNILVDALLPNITLRVTINRILESSNSSSDHQDLVSMTSKECPLAVDELQKMKKRKKPCDVDAVNVKWGVSESNMLNMNPNYSSSIQYMSNDHHVLPEESFAGQHVEIKWKREMSIDQFPSVVTC